MGSVVLIVGVILMVVIHEAGHFLAAKYFNIKATEAFFGFGPRIWSTQRGETEYGIKAFPLGGYVRIIGMNPLEEVDPEDEGRTYREKPFYQKAIVVLAGISSHFVVAFLLLFIAVMAYGRLGDTGRG
jgi:RIP metalloprotease RseP